MLSPLLALLILGFELLRRVRPSRRRGLRLLRFALIWLTAETAALFMCLGLWVASGFGGRLRTEPYQSRHYAHHAAGSSTGSTARRPARSGCGSRSTSPSSRPRSRPPGWPARSSCSAATPGPATRFLLVRQLLTVYERRPRVVMKASMQLDPGVDVVANRLPNVFIRPGRVGEQIFTEQIERLASGLDQAGALVIFPEGGNWTPGRWQRGIRRLERLGRRDLAARASQMPNVLPPRPGGALAAIAACPEADVIFVAHAGLDRAGQRARRLAEPADGPRRPREMVARSCPAGAALGRP